MTTSITIEVPLGVDYDVIVDFKEKVGSHSHPLYDTSKVSYLERSFKVSPGDKLCLYIYGDQTFISGIREVKRQPV